MEMTHADRAVVDIEKLRDYCLSPDHPRGRHKAYVFGVVLGLTGEHSAMLRAALLTAALSDGAIASERDEYGQRYTVDFPMDGPAGRAMIRSCWIVRCGEDFPRLTSCYVL